METQKEQKVLAKGLIGIVNIYRPKFLVAAWYRVPKDDIGKYIGPCIG